MSASGWECPKCGSVYAPWVSECSRCSPPKVGISWPASPDTTTDSPYTKPYPLTGDPLPVLPTITVRYPLGTTLPPTVMPSPWDGGTS